MAPRTQILQRADIHALDTDSFAVMLEWSFVGNRVSKSLTPTSHRRFQVGLGLLLSRLLELKEDHILRKTCHPKVVRFGLKAGLLKTTANGLVFSRSFRQNLCEMAGKYLTGELRDVEHLGDVVMAAIGSTLTGRTLPVYDEDFHFLVNEPVLVIGLSWDLARQTKIVVGGHEGMQVDPALEQELFDEAMAVFTPKGAPSQDARRIFNTLSKEIVFARLAIACPRTARLSPSS